MEKVITVLTISTCMCRLFGMLSLRSQGIQNVLVEDSCSLLKQSDAVSSKKQADGWGIAYLGRDMEVIRSSRAVFEEAGRYREVASQINTTLAMAHVRRASNSAKQNKDVLLSIDNIQPLSAEGWVFIHNGTLNFPDKVDLGNYRPRTEGKNDSNVLFWLAMKCITEVSAFNTAAIRAMESVLLDSAPEGEKPFTSINMVMTDGNELYAYCRYFSQPRKAFCRDTQGYYTMSYLQNEDRLVIMSEPSNDEEGWRALNNGSFLTARVNSENQLEVTIENLMV